MTSSTARAVRFNHYGGRDVLYVGEIPIPVPAKGEVLVQVRAAGINPGETNIRTGVLHDRFPATFPSGQGSDLAGVVVDVGPGVDAFGVGDEVLGFSWRRSSHATHANVPVTQLIRKSPQLSWEVAGSLYVAGCTAYAAVRAVAPRAGETIAVSAAAGGVGSLVVQLLTRLDVNVLGLASAANEPWLRTHGVTRIDYGDRVAERLTAVALGGIDAFIDLFGSDYVQLAVDLGIRRDRIETIIAFDKAAELGTKADGSATASTTDVLAEIADLVAAGELEVPIAASYPLDRVQDAFAQLEHRHTHGKIVLTP